MPTEQPWTPGAVHVVLAWLAIGLAATAVSLLAGVVRAMFIAWLMLMLSALASPVYGTVVYLRFRRRGLPQAAKAAGWTSGALFFGALGLGTYAYLLLQAIGRGLR